MDIKNFKDNERAMWGGGALLVILVLAIWGYQAGWFGGSEIAAPEPAAAVATE